MSYNIAPCPAAADSSSFLRPLFRMASGLELLLASASPRRRQFLTEWGIPFRLALTSADEPRPEQGESPETYTRRAATAKALASGHALRQQGAASGLQPVILAADTVVAVDGDILGKPENPAHAMRMLERLNGRGHEVISAVCLLLPADAAFSPAQAAGSASTNTGPTVDECGVDSFLMLSFSDTSRVFLHHWPQPVLQAYLDTGEPHDKAGAYAIQGQGAVLVERVDGSWSTVVGLPVTQLAQVMLDRGLMLPCA
nr:Maf family protein [Desulfovibrio sp. UIB00]